MSAETQNAPASARDQSSSLPPRAARDRDSTRSSNGLWAPVSEPLPTSSWSKAASTGT